METRVEEENPDRTGLQDTRGRRGPLEEKVDLVRVALQDLQDSFSWSGQSLLLRRTVLLTHHSTPIIVSIPSVVTTGGLSSRVDRTLLGHGGSLLEEGPYPRHARVTV